MGANPAKIRGEADRLSHYVAGPTGRPRGPDERDQADRGNGQVWRAPDESIFLMKTQARSQKNANPTRKRASAPAEGHTPPQAAAPGQGIGKSPASHRRPNGAPAFDTRAIDWLYLGVLLLVGTAIYWRSLWGPFLFDDADLFEARSVVRLQSLRALLTTPRPLVYGSYVLNYRFWGFDAFYFRLFDLILHLVNAAIVWRIVRLISDSPGLRGWLTRETRNLIAIFAPLLFLVAPVQTESVAYISSRSELLAATFFLLGLLVFLSEWRETRPWLAAVAVAFLYGCALASKQHTVTLPVAVLLADYFFLAGQELPQLKRNWRVYAVLGVLMVAGGAVVGMMVLHTPSAGFYLRNVTWKDYLFTQFRMYFLYLRLLLLPFGLNADYDIQPSRTLFQHGSWLALLGICVMIGAVLRYRRRLALASFGVLFFFLTLLPVSSFVPLLDYAAERRLYLPSIGFSLALLALALELPISRRVIAGALAALTLVYAVMAYNRSLVWSDSLALWLDTAQKSPGKWRVQNNLGFEYMQRRRFAEATAAYQKAADLVSHHSREYAEVLSSLGSTYNNRKMYAEAIPAYQEALKIAPNIPTLWTNLGIAEIRLNQREDGWHHIEHAMQVDPLAWEPHFTRGNLYYEMGMYDEAIGDYRRVLELVPGHPDATRNMQAAQQMKQRKAGGR